MFLLKKEYLSVAFQVIDRNVYLIYTVEIDPLTKIRWVTAGSIGI